MSRRYYVTLALIFIGIAVAGFIFGRVIIPRIILRLLDYGSEPPEAFHTGFGLYLFHSAVMDKNVVMQKFIPFV